jgi:hypothetical protein
MGKGRARCLAVPAPGRRPVARLTGQPEAGPGAVIGAGAVGARAGRGSVTGVPVAGRTPRGVPGQWSSSVRPVKFICPADAARHRFA